MKKIILGAFLASALCSNLIFIPIASADETEYFNCSEENLITPETEANTCIRLYPSLPTIKRLAPDSNCGWGNIDVCCCESKVIKTNKTYTCNWRTETTQNVDNMSTVEGGCGSTEKQSNNSSCDPAAKPENSYLGGRTTRQLCCCSIVSTKATTKAEFTMPALSIPINTINLSSATCSGADNSGNCEIPWIAEYIQGVYRYGLGIGGILAAIVLMAGGVLWLVSAGDASKITQAKDLILGSITGLIILVGSYIILDQINPELTTLKSISVKMLERITIESIENGSDSNNNVSNNCADESSLVDIKSIVSTKATSPELTATGKEGLSKAVAEAKKLGVELYVTSAYRTAAHQQELWNKAINKYHDTSVAAKYVARPGSCGGHRSGQAIDVCIKGTKSCQKMGSAAVADYSDEDVKKLQTIMKAAGWQRYCGEWWHFQYKESINNPC